MSMRAQVHSELSSLDRATEWLNSPPLTAAGLQGNVVLVDFWTYTCINWMRQLPYVRAWAEKYSDRGLVVIGVHTPEFSFESDLANVRQAAHDLRVDYPVVIDNDYSIWRAFDNAYWPALYFVDAQGRNRHHHFGEGAYADSEKVVQQLLAEAGAGGIDETLVSVDPDGTEAAADWDSLGSQETYIGSDRAERRASVAPSQLTLNRWALSGEWTVGNESALLDKAGGGIAHRFSARDLHLVMGPARGGAPVRFQVSLDGRAPGDAHGLDVDADGNGTASEQRMYQLIRQTGPVGEHTFEIAFLDPGVQAYSFTFG